MPLCDTLNQGFVVITRPRTVYPLGHRPPLQQIVFGGLQHSSPAFPDNHGSKSFGSNITGILS